MSDWKFPMPFLVRSIAHNDQNILAEMGKFENSHHHFIVL